MFRNMRMVRELAALVATAKSKCDKYAARDVCVSVFHVRSEGVRPRKSSV